MSRKKYSLSQLNAQQLVYSSSLTGHAFEWESRDASHKRFHFSLTAPDIFKSVANLSTRPGSPTLAGLREVTDDVLYLRPMVARRSMKYGVLHVQGTADFQPGFTVQNGQRCPDLGLTTILRSDEQVWRACWCRGNDGLLVYKYSVKIAQRITKLSTDHPYS